VNDLPDNLNVNAEIVVDDSVSQSDDFVPFHFRMSFLKIIRQPIRGFTYNLKVPDHRVDGLLVVLKGVK
jgi:hypothetical protein